MTSISFPISSDWGSWPALRKEDMLGISYVNLALQTNVIVNLGTLHSFLELNESTV